MPHNFSRLFWAFNWQRPKKPIQGRKRVKRNNRLLNGVIVVSSKSSSVWFISSLPDWNLVFIVVPRVDENVDRDGFVLYRIFNPIELLLVFTDWKFDGFDAVVVDVVVDDLLIIGIVFWWVYFFYICLFIYWYLLLFNYIKCGMYYLVEWWSSPEMFYQNKKKEKKKYEWKCFDWTILMFIFDVL